MARVSQQLCTTKAWKMSYTLVPGTATCVVRDLTVAGRGCHLFLYSLVSHRLVQCLRVFTHQMIHGIVTTMLSQDLAALFVWGGCDGRCVLLRMGRCEMVGSWNALSVQSDLPSDQTDSIIPRSVAISLVTTERRCILGPSLLLPDRIVHATFCPEIVQGNALALSGVTVTAHGAVCRWETKLAGPGGVDW